MIDVLIATVNCKNYDELLKKMKITTGVIVSNQVDIVSSTTTIFNGKNAQFLTLDNRGVGKNRNNALFNSKSEICMLSDDDVIFESDYEKKILNAFRENPHADVIIFNINDFEDKRFVIKKKMKINNFNFTKFGAARIAFKRDSVMKKRITFSTLFGGGARYSAGEDTLFLKDCLDKGLEIIALPEVIASLDATSESSWFHGYNEKLIKDTGACFSELFKKTFYLRILYFSIKRKKEYSKHNISFAKSLLLLMDGAKEYQNNEIFKKSN